MAIPHDRVQIARNVNATVIPLDAAPDGYAEFDSGVPKKFILDPHDMLATREPAGAGDDDAAARCSVACGTAGAGLVRARTGRRGRCGDQVHSGEERLERDPDREAELMPNPQHGIFVLGTASHAYLELDAHADPQAVVEAVAALREPRTTIGGVNLVAGFSPELWRAVAPEDTPSGLTGFRTLVVGEDGFRMPATQSP